MDGWLKVKNAAKYADVSERTLRSWLKCGLRHSRLESGTILIFRNWVDQYLSGFECQENQVDNIVTEICDDFRT